MSASYHFIKDEAYTEDDVLVYNIFVPNVSKKTTKHEILEYFKNFGDIVSVGLLNDYGNKSSRQYQTTWFVNYSDALAAAKALRNSNHSINNRRIWVRACDSWHQPDAQPLAGTTEVDKINTNDSLILNLNDDCLDVIFKHLNIRDQINLARCCNRLKDVFVMHAKTEYKVLDLEHLKLLTLWETRQFLQMAGPHIKKLGGIAPGTRFKRVVEFLGIYCTSVKSVSVTNEILSEKNLRKLLKNMKLVEDLDLSNDCLTDDCIPVLKKIRNLKILSLNANFNLTGKHIKELTTVESLSLHNTRITSTSLRMISENLKGLKFLDIEGCLEMEISVIKDIAKNLHKLETIRLCSSNDQVECIASLPSLKHLHLFHAGPYDTTLTQLFVNLANYRAWQLETLVCNHVSHEMVSSIGKLRNLKKLICSNSYVFDDNCLDMIAQLQELEWLEIENCQYFSGKGLLHLIQKCPKLSTINVSKCRQLNEEFPTKLLELLKSQREQRDQKNRMEIIANYSGIPFFAVNVPAIKSATDLLAISIYVEHKCCIADDSDGSIYDDDVSGFDFDYDSDRSCFY